MDDRPDATGMDEDGKTEANDMVDTMEGGDEDGQPDALETEATTGDDPDERFEWRCGRGTHGDCVGWRFDTRTRYCG
jgi:hypothetical protein